MSASGSARGEDLRHPASLQLRDVVVGDDAARKDEHVAGAPLGQRFDEARNQRHVGARQDRQADGVGVLLDDRFGNLFRRLVQPRVNDLETRLPQGPGDDPGTAIVTIEAGFGYHHPVGALHRYRYSQVDRAGSQPADTRRHWEPLDKPNYPIYRRDV